MRSASAAGSASAYRAASPPVYGTAAVGTATTGSRSPIASTSGTQNPSCRLVTSSTSAVRYSALSWPTVTLPVTSVAPPTPCFSISRSTSAACSGTGRSPTTTSRARGSNRLRYSANARTASGMFLFGTSRPTSRRLVFQSSSPATAW